MVETYIEFIVVQRTTINLLQAEARRAEACNSYLWDDARLKAEQSSINTI